MNRRSLDPQSPSGHSWTSPRRAHWVLDQPKRWLGVADCGPQSVHVGSRNGSPWSDAGPGGQRGAWRSQLRSHLMIIGPTPSRLDAATPSTNEHYRALSGAGRAGDRPLRSLGQSERLQAEAGNLAAARWYMADDAGPQPHLFRVLRLFWTRRDRELRPACGSSSSCPQSARWTRRPWPNRRGSLPCLPAARTSSRAPTARTIRARCGA